LTCIKLVMFHSFSTPIYIYIYIYCGHLWKNNPEKDHQFFSWFWSQDLISIPRIKCKKGVLDTVVCLLQRSLREIAKSCKCYTTIYCLSSYNVTNEPTRLRIALALYWTIAKSWRSNDHDCWILISWFIPLKGHS
jgi:hypothetical protein